ncbi:MAG TPA: restriction endonuclease subunit S [Candidatus Acidoferrales bacterium]|nr:restriction endonuclease subunit S [Candidatus Acidoferrales bacterium]
MNATANDKARVVTRTRYKPYPAYKNSGVEWLGEIPEHWEVKRLKTFTSVQLSNVDKKSVEGQELVWLCNYTDVYYNERITPNLEFMRATATIEQARRFSLRAGDVLITKDSESWTDIAVAAVVTQDLPGVLCGYHLAHIRPIGNETGRFLSRAFSAVGPRDQFQIAANGITRFGLGGDAIATGLFAVPSESEQRAIAAFLDRETAKIDALVAKQERLIKLLQEKRGALITRAVTKGLPSTGSGQANPTAPMKDSGVEWLSEIPAHWEVKRLRHLGEAIIGLTYGPDDVVNEDEGTLVLRASNVNNGRIVYRDNVFVSAAIPGHLRTRLGDILICARSGSRDLIGKNATVDERATGLTFGAFMIVFRSPRNSFLFYVFNSALFEYQSGSFLTSTINQLTLGNLKNMTVPVAPAQEQRTIADFLGWETAKIDALIAKVRDAIEQLKEYRTALISAAVTGKIDVREEAA